MFVGPATYWIGNNLVHFTNKADYDRAEYAEYVDKYEAEQEARGLPGHRTPYTEEIRARIMGPR
jgi:hypothetical protein